MANEVGIQHIIPDLSGGIVYGLIRNKDGDIWSTVAVDFETYLTANLANYDVAATEQGTSSRFYSMPVPAALPPGQFSVVFLQDLVDAAGSPEETDDVLGGLSFVWDGDNIVDGNLYSVIMEFNRDLATPQDEYTVVWMRNGVRISTGITLPTIQVLDVSDGSNRIASTAMTEIPGTQTFKYVAVTTEILPAAEAGIAFIGATIDGSVRSFPITFGRDG